MMRMTSGNFFCRPLKITQRKQRPSPDMAQKRRRDSSILPTWHENDVGALAFSRHGTETMSGQRCFPDMAQKRCRGSGVLPTWRRNDVGAAAFSRHDAETMSGDGHNTDAAQKR